MDQGASHLHAAYATASNGALPVTCSYKCWGLYLLLPRTLLHSITWSPRSVCLPPLSKYITPSPRRGF